MKIAVFFAGYLVTNRDNLAIGGRKFLGMRLRARDLGPIQRSCLAADRHRDLVLQRHLAALLRLFVAMLACTWR